MPEESGAAAVLIAAARKGAAYEKRSLPCRVALLVQSNYLSDRIRRRRGFGRKMKFEPTAVAFGRVGLRDPAAARTVPTTEQG